MDTKQTIFLLFVVVTYAIAQAEPVHLQQDKGLHPCEPNPCKNGATCASVGNSDGYQCTCLPGYDGINCENDRNECAKENGGCSHNCTNTPGSYFCSCPDPELSLAPDGHACVASDVSVECGQNDMSITLPKSLFLGLNQEHLTLRDANCVAIETETHYTLTTALTDCGTTSRHREGDVVYRNTVLKNPVAYDAIIRRVREIEIPFSCYYKNSVDVTSTAIKPDIRKLLFAEDAEGNFTVALEMFHDKNFGKPYSSFDFPRSLKLRQNIYLQAKVDSNDKRLAITAERCFATPTPNSNDPKKHVILNNGCPVDDTVVTLPSPSGYYRFSLEAFEFVEEPFVFIHCHVDICNASDAQSKCARGCEKNARVRRQARDRSFYSLALGPITLDQTEDSQEEDDDLAPEKLNAGTVMNVPLVAAMAAMTALTIFGVAFMALRNRSHDNAYQLLKI